ncbi:MAG TPA: nitrilase-related carbon-nitrogen hydrolase [Xanthomonadaceae bacterium]|jgi:apolipoprotein N-acyltransferase|nr:nitrilase-related carbon-nitrogen hydrolase [Xanthomonadaceae bacterium]
MVSRSDRSPGILLFFVATATSAALWWFGSGLHPYWWVTWLAPLPVLLLSYRVRKRWAAIAAFVAFTSGGLNEWSYFHDRLALPIGVVVPVIAEPGLLLALGALLFRRLMLQCRLVAAVLAVPTLWVAIAYLAELTSPHGTFGDIGYTQMNALPLIQIAAVTGIWGIGFLVLLLPAAIAALASTDAPLRQRLCAVAIGILLPTLAVGYGFSRLQEAPLTTLRVALVSLEKPIRPALNDPAGQALAARYVSAIDRLANAGARAVVIPEVSVATADATIPAFADVAQQKNLVLDAGIAFQGEPHGERNMAMVFPPGATAPTTYSKHHMVPGFEDRYTPSDGYTMLHGTPRTGLAICKDMDFHDIGRAYAARDAQLLLVPAWDFGADGWLHSRMAILRGVESGFAIARAARSGRLTLSDDRGRVVAEASSEDNDAELVGNLPLRETHTLYTRWGDWFAWVAIALAALCIAFALVPGQRRHVESQVRANGLNGTA